MGLETDLAKLVEEQPAGPGVKCLLYKERDNPTVAVHGAFWPEPRRSRGKSGLSRTHRTSFSEERGNSVRVKIADLLSLWRRSLPSGIPRTASSSQARMTSPWTKTGSSRCRRLSNSTRSFTS